MISNGIIGVKASFATLVEHIDQVWLEQYSRRFRGKIRVSTIDLTSAFLQADEILAEIGEQESDGFLREFDIDPFAASLEIQFYGGSSEMRLEVLVAMARDLSDQLGPSLLRVNSGERPVGLFEDGVLSREFAE